MLEYLLGDPGYFGLDEFILRRVSGRETSSKNNPVVAEFNKMHAGYRVQVEWGIGGMKMKFEKCLHTCPNWREAFELLLKGA